MTEQAPQIEDNKEYVDSLKKRMKTTSYAKFDAQKRYEKLNNSSLFALTSSSLLLIFVSIINKYSLCPTGYEAKVELISILVSIIILVLSLVVSLSSYSLKSERFLRTGNEILDLLERLNLRGKEDCQELQSIVTEYSVLRKNADNHQSYNYSRGRMERKNEDKKLNDNEEEKEDRKPNDNKEEKKDKISNFDNYCYWAPIVAFKVISLVSFIALIFMLHSAF